MTTRLFVLFCALCFACTTTNKAPKSFVKDDRLPAAAECHETHLMEECLHGGSVEAENLEFQNFADRIKADIDRQNKLHPGQDGTHSSIMRGFHAKNQTCLQGEFLVYDNNSQPDTRIRHGIFANPGKRWPVWVRFSNGVGWIQHDALPDVRGMAFKVMDVQGHKLLDGENYTQDFLMTNSPIPIGSDAADFMKFADSNSSDIKDRGKFLEENIKGKLHTGFGPEPIDGLPKFKPPLSIAALRFWSGSPYTLGSDQAVKFQVQPRTCDFEKGTIVDQNPQKSSHFRGLHLSQSDYLKKDMVKLASQKYGVCYEFFVQFQVDPVQTPIENNLIEWKEDLSKPVPVGLVMMPQQNYQNEKQDKFCDAMSFNPWHAIDDHKPLGHMNRARRVVYDVSRGHRGGGYEPKNRDVADLSGL